MCISFEIYWISLPISHYAIFFAASTSDFGTFMKAGIITLLRFRMVGAEKSVQFVHLEYLQMTKVVTPAYFSFLVHWTQLNIHQSHLSL